MAMTPPEDAPAAFAYHRAVAPMMWVLVAIQSIELVVVHLLLFLWWPLLGVIVSALTLAGIVWLVWVIRSFQRLPVLIDGEQLVMRVGTLATIATPLANVAGVRAHWSAAFLKQRHVRNFALIAYPNIVLELREALPGGRGVTAIAHKLDDRAGFVAALAARGIT